MRDNKREYQVWLDKAHDDLKWTESNIREKVYYGACFTAQQAAEKVLKAFLLYKQERFGKVHDLVKLIDECASYDKDFSLYRNKIAKLSFYYAQTRYPDITELDKFSQEEAAEALSLASEIVHFVSDKIIPKG